MSTIPRSRTLRRFRDPRSTVHDFLKDILVVCPRCAGSANVQQAQGGSDAGNRPIFAPRRLVCRHCGLAKAMTSRRLTFSRGTTRGATDPYFGLPLLLQTETRHGWLWAYNPERLTLIRSYAAASLRERVPWYDTGQKMTLVARLPVWIKHAKNRDEVLRAVDRLRAALIAD
ncbi:hypothetical protein [Kitasatospora kazusensis]|uniref:hypothetical protein n=1 Tax=Kitasatospora kazusensis TaxID=407974 RepID=UPI0031DA813B